MDLPQRSEAVRGAGTALELTGLARRFGRRWVLRGVSLRVAGGETVALMGRNGSGKTTLLRVVATALKPSRGGGSIYGHDLVTDADRIRELIGFLGHSPGLYDDLTAAENLRFSSRMAGLTVNDREIVAALDWAGLGAEAGERVRTFSAGMRRRLALARLHLRPPRLLLLDEPYASFDAEGIDLLNRYIGAVAQQGAAVLLATHDLARASTVVDRVVELRDGAVADLDLEPAPRTMGGGADTGQGGLRAVGEGSRR